MQSNSRTFRDWILQITRSKTLQLYAHSTQDPPKNPCKTSGLAAQNPPEWLSPRYGVAPPHPWCRGDEDDDEDEEEEEEELWALQLKAQLCSG